MIHISMTTQDKLPNWYDISVKILIHGYLTSICRRSGTRRNSGKRRIYTPLTNDQIEGFCQSKLVKMTWIIGCEPKYVLELVEGIRESVCGLPRYDIKDAVLLSLEKYQFSPGKIMKIDKL